MFTRSFQKEFSEGSSKKSRLSIWDFLKMRDLVKILIAVGAGVAIALTVALSVTLTREKPSSDDLGAQRFPDYNFVTFNDLWNGQLRTVDRISFGPQ